MARARTLAHLLRLAALPALAILIIANFAGYAMFGPNGLMAWGDYARMHDQRQAELAVLADERDQIANRVALLDPSGVDPDLADELVRRNTGQVRDDEHIVILED